MIDEQTARRIASEWHGGQSTYLYAFASSGAIDHDRNIGEDSSPLLWEIKLLIEHIVIITDDYIELLKLYAYIGKRYADTATEVPT